jgi:hypothetical protein
MAAITRGALPVRTRDGRATLSAGVGMPTRVGRDVVAAAWEHVAAIGWAGPAGQRGRRAWTCGC